MTYLMGIDVGTTGIKALLIDEKGAIVSRSFEEYPLYTPFPGWSEQMPEDWWRATREALKDLTSSSDIKPSEVTALGLTGQMHGSVFLGKDHDVLRPAILWNDQRTGTECEIITKTVGKERLIEITGNPALAGFTAPKILWVKRNQPEIYERTRKVLLPKDYVRLKLTGDFATDVADASGTLLLEVKRREWSDRLLDALDIDRDFLPEVFESPEVTGELTSEAATSTGLKKGTPVVAGAGDQAAGAVGTGIVREGLVSTNIGTSGVVFTPFDVFRADPQGRLHAFCHAVPGKWHLMGVMLSAGGSFRWFRDNLGDLEASLARLTDVDPYDLLTSEAARAPPGSEGLIFLPYLIGERTPYPDPNARGVFFGLTLRHSKNHMVRSVMEGVTYGLRDSLEIMRELGLRAEQVRVAGGGGRSVLWRQILADTFGADIVTTNVEEGTSFGAALLAGVGSGVYESVERACDQTIRITSKISPDEKRIRLYDGYYKIYRALYKVLKPSFDEIAEIVRGAG